MQSFIPTGAGSIVISGMESTADEYALKDAYLKVELEKLNALKEELRCRALDAVAQCAAEVQGSIKRVEIKGERGVGVQVSLPDVCAKGNRLPLKDESVERLKALGGAPEGAVEEETTVSLSGDWVPWIMGVLKSMQATGALQPDGLSVTKTQRLTAAGVAWLRQTLKADSDIAKTLAGEVLQSGLRSPTVTSGEPRKRR